MHLRSKILIVALAACALLPSGAAFAAEDPTYSVGLPYPYFTASDFRMKADGPTLMHVEAGSFGRTERGVWLYTLDPQNVSYARWGEVDGRMKVCTEPGGPAPNIDVAFFLDTTSNLGEVNGHAAWKAPAPGTCNENRFSFPIGASLASMHLGLQLIRYSGPGAAVWVEWADPATKAVDLHDPVVDLTGAPSVAVLADDAGRSVATIGGRPRDSESGIRELQGSLDGSSWFSVPSDPSFSLQGVGVHAVRLRAVDNAGRVGEPVSYVVRAYGRPVGTVQPTVSGTPRTGDTIEASAGSWDARSSVIDAFGYAWLRDGTPIAGAVGPTYRASDADVGTRIVVRVTAHNEGGWSDAIQSPATSLVQGRPALAATPGITGDAVVGSTLSAAPGSWSGSGSLILAYQWERCGETGAGIGDKEA